MLEFLVTTQKDRMRSVLEVICLFIFRTQKMFALKTVSSDSVHTATVLRSSAGPIPTAVLVLSVTADSPGRWQSGTVRGCVQHQAAFQYQRPASLSDPRTCGQALSAASATTAWPRHTAAPVKILLSWLFNYPARVYSNLEMLGNTLSFFHFLATQHKARWLTVCTETVILPMMVAEHI